jgi:hypothetical protein
MTRTIYAVAVLFIPIIFGIDKIYAWNNPAQHIYLNASAFSARSIFYFLAWGIVAYFLCRWSEKLRRSPEDHRTREKIKRLSAGGLVLYGFTVSFAAIDWVMSLEPSWYSTVYGLVYTIAQGLSAFAFILFILPRVYRKSAPPSKKALNDLANILLAYIMLWGYLSILQYLIIWSGNIPAEALWFNHRRHGGWEYLITGIATLQFAGPFIFLLFKDLKRNIQLLSSVGLFMLVIRIVDVFWFIMPAFHPSGWTVHLSDGLMFSAVGGAWILSFVWAWKRTAHSTGVLNA